MIQYEEADSEGQESQQNAKLTNILIVHGRLNNIILV
jgi:hypothetical protein